MTDPDDVLKKAGSFFTKLGSTMKSTAKQVTGIGRGNVRLELDVPKAAPGGTVKGRVLLELTEPTEAKRLVVTLRARQKVMTVSTTSLETMKGRISSAIRVLASRPRKGLTKLTACSRSPWTSVSIIVRLRIEPRAVRASASTEVNSSGVIVRRSWVLGAERLSLSI